MLWIISSEDDGSTNQVIDWLTYYGKKFVRTNETDKIISVDMELGRRFLLVFQRTNGDVYEVDVEKIKSYWYRRGEIKIGDIVKSTDPFEKYLIDEMSVIKEYIYYRMKQVRGINYIHDNEINKLEQLHKAISLGLDVPKTYVVSSMERLNNLIKCELSLITKSLFVSGYRLNENQSISWGTQKVLMKDIIGIPPQFYPSYLQVEIPKLWEIRSFFLHGSIYSSCIFSQSDEQTKVDFRNYNFEKPNRVVPYKLPINIEEKLILLFEKLEINSGSIDLIYGIDHKYYFLEINPIGQFNQVSFPCNYHLEKIICKYLIDLE